MGELWAVAIMLRIGLVQNLSRLSAHVLEERRLRTEADAWAERLIGDGSEDVDEAAVLRDLTALHPLLPVTLAVQLLRRLRAHEGERDIGPVVTWLENEPVTPHGTVEALIHWPDWFEQVSIVEQVLRPTPRAPTPAARSLPATATATPSRSSPATAGTRRTPSPAARSLAPRTPTLTTRRCGAPRAYPATG